jgi:hypothetical protein
VTIDMIAANGDGSCFGAISACFKYASCVPPYASDSISVSSIMM